MRYEQTGVRTAGARPGGRVDRPHQAASVRRAGLLVVLATVVLAGCSGLGLDPRSTPVAATGEPPEFVGPWAAELAELWEDSKSDLEREVLADERITEQEFGALEDWYQGCMANQRLRVITRWYGFDDDAETARDEEACATDSLSTALWMRGNPDNVRPDEAALACLIRHGDVPQDFTLDDYWDEVTRMPRNSAWWQELMDSGRFPSCMNDPFDIQGFYAAEVEE